MPSADNKKRVLKLQNRLRDRASVKDFELLACNNLLANGTIHTTHC